MTSSNFVLTLTLVAITSCHALPKPLSPGDSQQLFSILSARFFPRLSNPSLSPSQFSTASQEDDNNNNDIINDDNNDNVNNNNNNINSDNNANNNIFDNAQFSALAPSFERMRSTGGSANAYLSPPFFYPLQNGISLRAIKRLHRTGLWSLPAAAASEQDDDSGLITGRGKRFIPGINALFMARLLGNRNARLVDEAKWKRQPHLGFHASRG